MPRVSMTEQSSNPSESEDEPWPVESSASIRRTFVIITFVAGCLCLPPRQWVSAGILAVVTGLLYFRHVRITKREGLAKPKPAAVLPVSPVPDAPTEVSADQGS